MNQTEKTLNLLSLAAVWDKPFKEQLLLMDRSGFSPKEIAELLGMTANAVRARLSEMNRNAVRRKARNHE